MGWGTVCLHLMMWRRRMICTLSAEDQSNSSKPSPQISKPYRTVCQTRVPMSDILDDKSWNSSRNTASQEGPRTLTQGICESHSSLKHKACRWLLLQQGLVVKHRLHKIGMTDVAYVLCGEYETMEHVFWDVNLPRCFEDWSWFQAEYHFLNAPISWKGTLPGGTWMIW